MQVAAAVDALICSAHAGNFMPEGLCLRMHCMNFFGLLLHRSVPIGGCLVPVIRLQETASSREKQRLAAGL